ncbi:MAG: hypothetical protein H6970_15890 [Gammaproteobacteria bacterium]|nr:hypothetical protein [Gammaproteobacteria bacterium]MCP5458322.1 hypothetical protein [Gammaproteobacteria bacterium]
MLRTVIALFRRWPFLLLIFLAIFDISRAYAIPGLDQAKTITTAATTLNRYVSVTAVSGDTVTVSSIASLNDGGSGHFVNNALSSGDLILLYQAQGASFADTTNSATWGAINASSLNSAGLFEFAEVLYTTGDTIVLCANVVNTYTIGRVQAIRVPQYTSLTINSGASVVATAWNGTVGGVVALNVEGALTVNGQVSVDSRGFRGGARNSNGAHNAPATTTNYRTTDATLGAEKGESILGFLSEYDAANGRYGRGAPANGGGGGDAHNSSGGGGANGNNGGTWTGDGEADLTTAAWNCAWDLDDGADTGTANNFNCSPTSRGVVPSYLTTGTGGGRGGYSYGANLGNAFTNAPGNTAVWGGDSRRQVGGLGGRPLSNDPASRLFFGGGGGGGDNNNAFGTDGAPGGGLILVDANGLAGTGTLSANGGTVTTNAANDGSGGGGAGGTIVVHVNSAPSTGIVLRATGGGGGSQVLATSESEGPGGGGGGGYIHVSVGATFTTTPSVAGGANGTSTSQAVTEFIPNGATRGYTGQYLVSGFTFPGAQRCGLDFGDAPSPAYPTLLANNGPRHLFPASALRVSLGSLIDGETDGQPDATATGDDNNNLADEDGISSFPTASTSDGQYTVSVAYTNNTAATARLCGWIDFDRSNTFDADEQMCATVNSGSGSQDLIFTIPVSDRDKNGHFFARFRIAPVASEAESPTGLAVNGEAEDYQITIDTTLPITLASMDSRLSKTGLSVVWTTATETRNVGFHLYGRLHGEEDWRQLTTQLIPSLVIDSLDPQRYKANFPGIVVDELLLEDWDSRGQSDRHGPFEVGRSYGFDAVTHAQGIDWTAIRAENALDQARRDKARYAFKAQALASPDALLWVTQPGIQRIGFDALLAAGADYGGVDITELALTDDGQAVPRHVIDANTNGLFDSGDSIEFVGEVTPTLYSARNAYRLKADPTQVKAANSDTLNPKNAVSDIFVDTVKVEQQNAYSFTSPIDDPWYDQWLLAYGRKASLDRPFDLPGYAGGDATLYLSLWGVTDWPGGRNDHHLIVKVNGQPVDESWFDGSVDASRTIELPQDQLQETGNTLTLEAPGDTGFAYDIQAFDRFEVQYPRHTEAHDGAWQGAIPDGVTDKIRVDGFQNESVAWKGNQRRVGDATLYLRGQGNWIAADARAIHTPTVQTDIPTPAPTPTQGEVDYLIVSHPQFIDTTAMADLAALQEGRGYHTAVIDVDTLYAAYSDFEVDAEAIRRYLKAARPSFVLLVGGDSYDYHDNLGLASQSFVPTHYAATGALVTYAPADGRYVDYNDNGIPQAAIGRLPARTEAEFGQLVAKLQRYIPPTRALFAAGPSDSGRQFAEVSEGYVEQLPADLFPQTFYVDDLGLNEAKAELTSELNLAGALVSYVGHSSYRIWGLNPSRGILFWADDARALNNPTPHIVTQWGCWNTYFVDPKQDTMANGFLFQDEGAAAVLGATTLTDLRLLRDFGNAFFDQIGRRATVGEALRYAQRRYVNANPSAASALRGFALLGDPAAELQ